MYGILSRDAIRQESNVNTRNMTTIAGHILVADGFSNILGWLVCANTTVHFYPENDIYSPKIIDIHLHSETKKGFGVFIDHINIPIDTSIVWETISRTPDDFPLVGVFYNKKTDHSTIALTGFCSNILFFEFKDNLTINEEFKTQLINAYSQFSNQFISFNYYLETSSLILKRLLEKGSR